MRHLFRELKFFLLVFVLPTLVISALQIGSSSNSMRHALWKITHLEDFCAFGTCYLLPALAYIVFLVGRLLFFVLAFAIKFVNSWMRIENIEYTYPKDKDS